MPVKAIQARRTSGRLSKRQLTAFPYLKSGSGQSMVEFALAIPFLLLCVVAVIYFGRAFFLNQIIAYAAQSGARVAAAVPNLSNSDVRDSIRGFTTGGTLTNSNSVIYSALGAAGLLSNGSTGNLPPGAVVKILPFDGDGSPQDTVPTGTVAVRIDYPFSLFINPFTGQSNNDVNSVSIAMTADSGNPPVAFKDFVISQKATVAQEVYQEGN